MLALRSVRLVKGREFGDEGRGVFECNRKGFKMYCKGNNRIDHRQRQRIRVLAEFLEIKRCDSIFDYYT